MAVDASKLNFNYIIKSCHANIIIFYLKRINRKEIKHFKLFLYSIILNSIKILWHGSWPSIDKLNFILGIFLSQKLCLILILNEVGNKCCSEPVSASKFWIFVKPDAKSYMRTDKKHKFRIILHYFNTFFI